jgi:type IV secretory pathway VirB10-like protein
MGVEEKAQLLKAIASHSRFGSGVTRIAMGMEEKVRQLKARLPQPLFASRKSLVIAACVVFVLGFLLGGLLLKAKNEEPPNPHNAVRSKITSEPRADKVSSQSRTDNKVPSMSRESDQPSAQTQPSGHVQTVIAPEVALASVPEEEVETVGGITPEEPKEVVVRSEITSQRTVMSESRDDKIAQAKVSRPSRTDMASSLSKADEALSLSKADKDLSSPKPHQALSSSKGSKETDRDPAPSSRSTYTPAGVASEDTLANVREEKADFFHSLLSKEPKEKASIIV